jgi:hemerythrin-like domain-containing protein
MDVIAVLTQDHREVEQMFGEFDQTPATDLQGRRVLADRIITELVKHSVAEEQYLYPAARELIPNGAGLVDEDLKEHASAEETMKKLDGLDPSHETFVPLMHELMTEIRQHVQHEEGELFPLLAQNASQERLDQMGQQVERAKKTAPTHPHPSAPDTPPANKVMGAPTSLIDRIRDMFTHRGQAR